MFNEISLVTVTPFSGSDTPDKNGKKSVMFQPIAGKIPNLRQVIAGTIAERLGIKVGETYLMKCRESGFDKKFGTDFTWTKIKENLSVGEILQAERDLGVGEVIVFNKPEEAYDYTRKTDAIESLRTQRIKEGNYIPSTKTSVADHETVELVKEGSSLSGEPGDLALREKLNR